MRESFEPENAVEVKYDALAREYTVICACREPCQQYLKSSNRSNAAMMRSQWTIHSVVVIDAIQNQEMMHNDLTGRMSCTSALQGWVPRTRLMEDRHLSPFPKKNRSAALRKQRSLCVMTSAASVDSMQLNKDRWKSSSLQIVKHNSITPRASIQTQHRNKAPGVV